jgi:hypothetical protein
MRNTEIHETEKNVEMFLVIEFVYKKPFDDAADYV